MAIAGRRARVYRSVLGGRGEVVDHEIEQMVGADVAQAGGKQHGENPVFLDCFVQRRYEMFFGNRSFVEKLFHQLVFAFSNNLHQFFVGFLGSASSSAGIGPSLPLPLPPIS